MSNRREQVSEKMEAKSLEALLYEYAHIPVLAFLVGFAFWNRLRNWENFVIDGTVFYSGNDPWYHLRMTQYTVNNFPQTMPFDPWTYFPYGTSSAQFGTFMDQIIALVALIVGLGSPSESLVRHIFLLTPPFIAVFVCIPAYLMGRRLGYRLGGIIVVGLIAFAPDSFLRVSLAGVVDHHVFEVLFMTLSILGVMVALTAAEKEKPVYELVRTRNFDAIRGTIGWSMLAGVAMAFYMWVWPPGLWIFFVLSAFFLIQMSIEHLRGQSPEHVAFAGVISILTTSLLQLSTTRTLDIAGGPTVRSLTLPALGFVTVAGIVFLAWFSRELDSRDLPRYAYPASVFGILVVGSAVVALAVPEVWDFLISQFDRVFGYILRELESIFPFISSTEAGGGTIGEGQPMQFSEIQDIYKLATFTGILGAGVVLIKQVLDDDPRSEQMLVVVWAALMVVASLTQVRFAYYLTIPVGVLNAILVGYVVQLTGTPDKELLDIETYQVMVILVIVLLVFAPILPAVPLVGEKPNAVTYSDNASKAQDVVAWNDSLSWMNENTPKPGQYGNPDGEPMDLYGETKRTDDFDYPEGAYGVLSWWDYGHWITTQGERIPNANPFQQGPKDAARFLLAQDEEEALNVLSDIESGDDAETKYVVIDWRMIETQSQSPIRGKFFAPTVFHPEYEQNDFYKTLLVSQEERQGSSLGGRIQEQPYYNSMAVRLYHYHGSEQKPQPYVIEWNDNGTFQQGGLAGQRYITAQFGDSMQIFPSMVQARQYVRNHSNAQIGGIGGLPEERVDGLEHFRLVHMSKSSAFPRTERDLTLRREHGVNNLMSRSTRLMAQNTGFVSAYADQLSQLSPNMSQEQLNRRAMNTAVNQMLPTDPAFTKVFERVPGATVEGTGPENTIVRVDVTLQPDNGREFTYSRTVATDQDGNFELTVPYATQGYDEYGVEEGYTNTSIRANTSYAFTTRPTTLENGSQQRWVATTEVSEGQVLGEEPGPVTVELEKEVIENEAIQGGDQNGTDAGEQNGTNAGDESGNETSGGDGNQTDDGNETSGSVGLSSVRPGGQFTPVTGERRYAVV